MEELFDAIHRVLLETTKIMVEHSLADLFYLSENTSTTLISPAQYRKYCFHHLTEYANICFEADRHLVLHMCGRLKAILPDLAQLKAKAFEAYTSSPVGNTSFYDGRSECKDICFIGGTNAALWTDSADEIIGEIERDLNALDHHRGIVVTSAGVMPPVATPETIREVCQWVRAYPI